MPPPKRFEVRQIILEHESVDLFFCSDRSATTPRYRAFLTTNITTVYHKIKYLAITKNLYGQFINCPYDICKL